MTGNLDPTKTPTTQSEYQQYVDTIFTANPHQKPDVGQAMDELRSQFKDCAQLAVQLVPPSKDLEKVISHLEDAFTHAWLGIERNQDVALRQISQSRTRTTS